MLSVSTYRVVVYRELEYIFYIDASDDDDSEIEVFAEELVSDIENSDFNDVNETVDIEEVTIIPKYADVWTGGESGHWK